MPANQPLKLTPATAVEARRSKQQLGRRKMRGIRTFKFARSRGVVWVCDLADSSKYLNDDSLAKTLEDFLPRFYWTAVTVVESAGGRFIKWTGDGFLAWFETSLHRDLGQIAAAVFNAAWHLTFLVNVTQLGLSPGRKFHTRHGITYEHDALLVKIIHADGHESLDLMGRAVVLAFRLCGIEASFPNIVAVRELIEASAAYRQMGTTFQKRRISREERLKFFKGQDWGTSHVYVSVPGKRKLSRIKTVVNLAKMAIAKAERACVPGDENSFSMRFLRNMMAGPKWCKDVVGNETDFLRNDLLRPLKQLLPTIEKLSDLESEAREGQPSKALRRTRRGRAAGVCG